MKQLASNTYPLIEKSLDSSNIFDSTTAKTLLWVAGLIWCYAIIAYVVQTSYGWILGYAAFFIALYQVLRSRNQQSKQLTSEDIQVSTSVIHHHHYIVQNHYHQKQNSSENKGYVRCEEIRE